MKISNVDNEKLNNKNAKELFDIEAPSVEELNDVFGDHTDNEDSTFYEETQVGENEVPGDCAIRALSYVLDKPYNDVKFALDVRAGNADATLDDEAGYSLTVIEDYLKDQDWNIEENVKTPYGQYYTVEQFCQIQKRPNLFNDDFIENIPSNNRLIIDCQNPHNKGYHVTVINNKKIVDNYNCGNFFVRNYFYKGEKKKLNPDKEN